MKKQHECSACTTIQVALEKGASISPAARFLYEKHQARNIVRRSRKKRMRGTLKQQLARTDTFKPCELKLSRRCLNRAYSDMKGCYWCNLSNQKIGKSWLVRAPIRRLDSMRDLEGEYKKLL